MNWRVTKDKTGYELGTYTVRYNKHSKTWTAFRNRGYDTGDHRLRIQHMLGNREYIGRSYASAQEARKACDLHRAEVAPW